MKTLFLLAGLIFGSVSMVLAAGDTLSLTGAGGRIPPAGGSPSYTGIGDLGISNIFSYNGLRAYSASTRGNAVANVCNSTGGVDVGCADMVTDATTGALVPATISLITCPGTNCTVKTLYDTSGQLACGGSVACDMTQTTVANRPVLTASCIGSMPCMTCSGLSGTGGSAGGLSTSSFTINQPFTITAVASRSSGTAFADILGFNSAGQVQFLFDNAANKFTIYAGTVAANTTATTGTTYALGGMYNSSSSAYSVNGSSTTGLNAGVASAITPMTMCNNNNPLTGTVAEIAIFAGDKSSSLSAISANQRSFWGF